MGASPTFTLDQVVENPDFKALDLPDKNAFLMQHVPEFSSGAPKDRSELLNTIHYGGGVEDKPQESTGFVSGLTGEPNQVGVAAALGRLVRTPYEMGKAALTPPQTAGEKAAIALGPGGLLAKRMILDPAVETAGKALGSPTASERMGYAGATALPLVGPWAASLGERAGRGDISGAATELAGGLAAGEAMGKALPEIREFRTSPERGIAKVTEAYGFPAGKGGRIAAQGEQAIRTAAQDLAEIQRDQPLRGAGSEKWRQHAEQIDQRQQQIWNEAHKPQIQRWEKEPTETGNIVAGASKGLPAEIADAAPGETAKAKEWINDVLAKPRTLGELDDFLRELNNDIKNKPYERYGRKEILVRQEAAKASRDEIDRTLEAKGEPGVREFNRRWGALDTLKDRAQEQAVREFNQESRKSVIPDWVHTYGFLHRLSPAGAAVGVGFNLGRMLRPTAAGTLGRGMEQLARSPLEPPAMPPFRLVPPEGRMPHPEQGEMILPPPMPWQEIGTRGEVIRGGRLLPQGEGVGPLRMPPSPLSPVAGSEPTPTGGARGYTTEPQPNLRYGGYVRGIPAEYAISEAERMAQRALPAGRPPMPGRTAKAFEDAFVKKK